MSLAVLLSGQGAQHRDMFALTAEHPPAQAVFEAARPLLDGTDPRDLVADAAADLHGNRTGQILCCVAALAGWTLVAAARPARAIVAGYSIGDLAAWGCAGRLDVEAVLRIAAARAEAMDAASGEGFGLAGLRGLPLRTFESMAERRGLHPAIRNAADSLVIGGRREGLAEVCQEALAAGAARAVILAVHTPSHTPLLNAASARLAEILSQETPRRPPPGGPRLVSGLDGDPVFDVRAGLDKLARQVSQTIDWAACLEACREHGATKVLELGPGHALTTMAHDALPDARIHALEDFRSVDGVTRWLSDE